MKTFLLLLVTSLSLFANAPSRKIQSISYRSNYGATIALIQLSDGSIWEWCPDIYSVNLLRNWSPGDEILIQVTNHSGFAMKNLNNTHYIPKVALSFNSYPLFPTVIASDSANGAIQLSDGTHWRIQFDFNKKTLLHWIPGDRIIAVKGVKNNYELINIDIPYDESNRCQIERFMEVAPY